MGVMSDGDQIGAGFGDLTRFSYKSPKQEGKTYTPVDKMLAISAEHYQSITKILYKISRKKKYFLKSKPKFVADMEKFVELLEKLQIHDLSHDIPFLQELTNIWFKILGHQHRLLTKGIKGDKLDKVNMLIDSLDSYPEGDEQSVHYYLSHFVGKDWFPFPFMETLQKLHQSPIKLAEWVECAKTGQKNI